MKAIKIFYSTLLFLAAGVAGNLLFAAPPGDPYQLIPGGVIIYPDPALAGNVKQVRLLVISEQVIRVTSFPADSISERESLIIIPQKQEVKFQVTMLDDTVFVKTAQLTAKLVRATGAVSFFDNDGQVILREKSYDGKSFTPVMYEGKLSYAIGQRFETQANDGWYGLGQHQDGQFNYKGKQVYLFQNNTEIAIPFLLSNKNYGILWDNYSITRVGDVRPYLPLSSLQLYSKENEKGWLTASYNNEKDKPGIHFSRAESAIHYPYLGDAEKNLPDSFNAQKGMVTWEGFFSSAIAGTYLMKIIYGGYMKAWIDGKLLEDRWRQSWNPGTALLELTLQKAKKYAIKIQWIPDGSASYLDVSCQPPLPSSSADLLSFSSEAGQTIDYYFVKGKDADEVISGYRQLTGKATMLPRWAFGFWQSRERYKTQEEVLQTVAEFRQRKIPLDNIVQDWSYWKENDWGSQEFDSSRFPDPGKMISELHKKYHANFMISVWPKFYEGIDAFKSFGTAGFLYKRNIADRQRDWIGKGYVSTFYDAFNVKARESFWELLNKKLYSKGVDAWWMDASEPDILSNVSPAKRILQMTPLSAGIAAEYVNAYPLENAKGIYFGQRNTDPGKRVFLLTRSAFAGSQHYAAAVWSGDIASRWEDMKAQIPAGLNYSLSGLPYWTMDIGGFAVEHRYEKPNEKDLEEWRELQTRWYQFGAFVPIFRVHGQYPFREIFHIAPDSHPAYQSMLYYDQLRYRLLPYIYSIAAATYHDDYTMMRALIMDFGSDTTVNNIGDQYMFGPSLLVNPVCAYKASERKVYLPKGQGWYDLYTGKYFTGGQFIHANAPYERMPVFVKEGAIIPVGPALQYSNEKPADSLILLVYTGKDASFNLYMDDGSSYAYEKNAYVNIPIRYDEATHTVTIRSSTGKYPGMLSAYAIKIVSIHPGNPVNLSFTNLPGKWNRYTGKEITIRLK